MAATDPYGAVRRDEYSTLGDAYRMCRQDPEAFAAGAQYALDKMHAEWERYMMGIIPAHTAEFLSSRATEILQRALDGEPQ
jgi:hypothetical protein